MTWQSAISSKPIECLFHCLAGVFLFSAPLSAATISGHVVLVNSKDSAVRKEKNFADVAVWLTSSGTPAIAAPAKHAQMLQKGKRFVPELLVVTRGSLVDFPNLDPIFHNAFSNFYGQIFDVALYPPGSSRSVRFARAGIVRVFCNIHPSMSAIIVVVDSTHFATTGRDGSFTIANVSPGPYEIHFFHERATPETIEKLTQRVQIGESPLELPPVSISEAGYLPAAHKNKYGRDYPPDSDATYSMPSK